MAMTTIYFKDGTTNSVPDYDVSYWETQGWSKTKPAEKPVTTSDSGASTGNTAGLPQWMIDAGYTVDRVGNPVPPGQKSSTPSQNSGTSVPVSSNQPAQNKDVQSDWVNQLYQKYFDRSASAPEMANWSSQTPQSLDLFLQSEAKRYGYTSSYFKTQRGQALQSANAIIDADVNLTPEMKAMAKSLVSVYSGGVQADAPSILKAFDTLKQTTIDPYFADLVNQQQEILKRNIAYVQGTRQTELEGEKSLAQKNIEDAKASLESSGKTFTGEAGKLLGDQAAYGVQGQTSVIPFGNYNPEGNVQQSNRLMATTSQQRYLENLRQIGQTAEQALGSSQTNATGYQNIGGIKGSISEAQQTKYGDTLQKLMSNAQQKNALNVNINPLA